MGSCSARQRPDRQAVYGTILQSGIEERGTNSVTGHFMPFRMPSVLCRPVFSSYAAASRRGQSLSNLVQPLARLIKKNRRRLSRVKQPQRQLTKSPPPPTGPPPPPAPPPSSPAPSRSPPPRPSAAPHRARSPARSTPAPRSPA